MLRKLLSFLRHEESSVYTVEKYMFASGSYYLREQFGSYPSFQDAHDAMLDLGFKSLSEIYLPGKVRYFIKYDDDITILGYTLDDSKREYISGYYRIVEIDRE